jgi:outer membrane receptor protein involved in Fe transport
MRESLCYLLLVGCLLGKAAAQNQQPLNSSTKDHNLPDVEVVSQYIESTRKTPISVSTVSAAEIGQKIGVRPLPYALQRVPSLYVRQGNRGEDGAQIYLRGFDQSSIGLLLNGTPISDMEYGRVFWSQWGMLARFAQNIQVQRGLGASKTIINSVGGSINILTQNTSLTPSATVEASYGSQNAFQTIVSGASGLLKGNWMVNAGFGYEQTDGYNEGTAARNYFYFATVSKSINRNHHLSLTVLGAPTRSGIRGNSTDWGSDELYQNAAPTANAYGTSSDKSYQKAHLPFTALTHKWMLNDNMSLQSAVYFTMRNAKKSYAEVDGVALDSFLKDKNQKNNYRYLFNRNTGIITSAYKRGNHIDFDKLQAFNSGSENPWQADLKDNRDGRAMFIMKAMHSDYKWWGGVSSFNWDIYSNLRLMSGLDLRYYTAEHYHTLDNILGGKYYLDLYYPGGSKDKNKNPNQQFKEGDRIDYAYRVDMFSTGLFSQLEYQDDYISAFFSAAGSNTGYQNEHYTDRLESSAGRITPWYAKWGFNVRTGLSYNFTPNQNIYWNAGVFSKAPYIDVIFIGNGAVYNPKAKNEKIYSTEIGYGFQLANFNIQAGTYYTLWTDRARNISNNYNNKTYRGFMYNTGQQHYGVELETQYVPTKYAQLSASAAWGDWRFTNNPSGNLYEENDPRNPIAQMAYIKNLKVPNAPQVSANFGLTSNLYKGFYIGLDASYFDLLYADINANNYTTSDNKKQMWRMPAYYLIDGRIGWENIKLAKDYFFSLQLNVYNLTNHKYISEFII